MSKNTGASISAAFALARLSDHKQSYFSRVRGRLVHAARVWLKSRRQRQTVNILMALSDRQLKDIGLTRSEVLSTVYGPNDAPMTRFHPY